jgi:plastocyanin
MRTHRILICVAALTMSAVGALPTRAETIEIQVVIRDNAMRFEPASVEVRPGDQVVWTNQTPLPHLIEECSPELELVTAAGEPVHLMEVACEPGTDDRFGAGQIAAGNGTFSWSVPQGAGVAQYRCGFHPDMRGEVRIVSP